MKLKMVFGTTSRIRYRAGLLFLHCKGRLLGWVVILVILAGCKADKGAGRDHVLAEQVEVQEWVSLFNGENLDGWDIKIAGYELNDNYNETFLVKDNILKVSYDNYDGFNNEFGHLFYDQPFSHYRLRVEYRFIGDQVPNGPGWAFRNNGIMFHCQSAASMYKDQDFPISLEAQLLGGNGKEERSTMNLCTPGTHVVINGELRTEHCISSSSETYDGDQWVTAELVVYGDSLIRHYVNDQLVMEYEGTQTGGGNVDNFDSTLLVEGASLQSGYIALQAESHPTEFRKIELLDLSTDN